jgi:hypothetical protein
MSAPIDFTTVPYKYDPKGREEYGIHPDLHILLCDLSIKLPKIAYESHGVSFNRSSDGNRVSDNRVVSEVLVYNNEEKIGKIGITQDYVDGKYINIYQLDSPRIQQQRGMRNRKRTKHYKIALKTALDAFKEFPPDEVAKTMITDAGCRIHSIRQNANSQLTACVNVTVLAASVLSYMEDVVENGPQPLPPNMMLDVKWRDHLATYRIVDSVFRAWENRTGLLVKLLPSGVMTVVDLTIAEVVMVTSNTYDLPVEYQEKLAILKIMENNQAIEGMGVKIEDEKIPHIYMTAGAIQTTC